jgi:hypothetical protein
MAFAPLQREWRRFLLQLRCGEWLLRDGPGFSRPGIIAGCALPFEGMAMPRDAKQDGIDKFRPLRANRKARGMKLVHGWVPDPKAPGFAEEARREAALLRGAPEEQEALDFIEAVMDTDDWK